MLFDMIAWYVIASHFILAIILFFIVNWIGEKSKPLDFGYVQLSVSIQDDTAPLFNYFFKVLAPVVYIILLIALFQLVNLDFLNEKIYWVVIYYWAFRFMFITVKGQVSLINWPVQIIYWVSSIGLAIWVYSLADKIGTILPDPKSLLEEFWILIIIFLYSVFNKLEYSREGAKKRVRSYTSRKYFSFKEKFGPIVDELSVLEEFKVLAYAIMVYEDFNRPRLARTIERIVFHWSTNPHTYGVMQVTSSKPLSDDESVRQGVLMINALLKERLETVSEEEGKIYIYSICYDIAAKYNPGHEDYASQVMQVYDNIKEMHYPHLRTSVEKSQIII